MKKFEPKDSIGRWRILTLFTELHNGGDQPPVYTLEEARQLYMEQDDPTEYKAAMAILGSWEHWKVLCASVTLRPILDKWREELSVKIRSDAITNIMIHSHDPKGFTAAKWLAEKGWAPKAGKGRPKKEDVDRAAREEARLRETLADDAARISLVS